MDTNHAPAQALPADVLQRIASYRPSAMDTAQWECAAPSVIELVTACPPANSDDARDLLTSAVAFLVASHPWTGSWDLRFALSAERIVRYQTEWLAADRPVNTLRNHLGRLNRLARSVRGESGARQVRSKDADTSSAAPPYTEGELAAFHEAVGQAPPDIVATLQLSLKLAEQGTVMPDAAEHGLDSDSWDEMRSWLRSRGVPQLNARQLRRTWAYGVVCSSSVLEAVRRGVTRGELESLLPHLHPNAR